MKNRKMHWIVFALIAALALCLGSCGDGDELDCSFSACGGDVVGKWKVTTICNAEIMTEDLMAFCPSASISINPKISGTVEYKSDGSYSADLAITISGSMVLPAACTAGAPSGSTCADLPDLTCTGDISKQCSCIINSSEDVNETGTWATSGNTLTSTVNGSSEQLEYCVSGDTLKAKNEDGIAYGAVKQ